jgi:tetratricopeptide (TPR) repeat protein
MQIPSLPSLHLGDGILLEATVDKQQLVVWLRRGSKAGVQRWERISTVPGAEVRRAQGLAASPATAVTAKHRVRGCLGRWFGRHSDSANGQSWVLPNGERAEQEGERQSDLLLVWAEDEATALDEAQVRARWPQARQVERLGRNLFVVCGVEPPSAAPVPLPSEGCPKKEAEELLAAARRSGDCRRQVLALNDLGIICTRSGEEQRAVALLEEAVTLARQLGDPVLEGDVRGSLGLALLKVEELARALELLEQSLALARAAGDRFGEKRALEHLGTAREKLGEPDRALELYEPALALARELGDRRHEADLLWLLARQHAALRESAQAVARGQASVELRIQLGDPNAGWYADSVRRYQAGEAARALPQPAAALGASPPGDPVPDASAPPNLWRTLEPVTEPGVVQMAFSAAKSMARFIGSGLKTVPAATHRQRLQTCGACVHHSGLRCRICGCFTGAKARMAHEQCPLGKWAT